MSVVKFVTTKVLKYLGPNARLYSNPVKVNSAKSVEKDVKQLKAKLSDEQMLGISLEAKVTECEAKAEKLDKVKRELEKEKNLSRDEDTRGSNNVKLEAESRRKDLVAMRKKIEAIVAVADEAKSTIISVEESEAATQVESLRKCEDIVNEVNSAKSVEKDVKQLKAKLSDEQMLGISLEAKVTECEAKAEKLDKEKRELEKEKNLSCDEDTRGLNNVKLEAESRRKDLVAMRKKIEAIVAEADDAKSTIISVEESEAATQVESLRKCEDIVNEIHDKAKRCNYANPTPIQRHAIPSLMAGRDLMACAQTVSGKTAAFRFPINARSLNIRPRIGGGGFRGHSRPACPLALIMSPTRELSSQVAKSKLPFFGSRVQYRSLYNSSSATYWKSSVSFDDGGFYNDHIRSRMNSCYEKMIFTPQILPRVIRFISVVDFVSLVLRYPSGFEDSFWNELVDNWIVVEDNDKSTYPPWFLPLGLSVLILKQSVEILCPPLPAPGVDMFYCDGSPSNVKDMPGGGGVLRVEYTGKDTAEVKVSAFAVVVQYCDSFETEARVLLAAANYAKREGLQRCVFYSDNLDLIEGLNGRRRVRVGYLKLISQIIDATSHLKERWFVHTPREGVAASDEIARQVRVVERYNCAHKKLCWPGQMKKLDVVKEGLVEEHYGKLIRNVLPTGNLILKLNKACFRTPLLRFEFLSESEASLPREKIEKKLRFCPEKEYGTGSPGFSPR